MGDFILESKKIFDVAIVLFRPQVMPVGWLHQPTERLPLSSGLGPDLRLHLEIYTMTGLCPKETC